MDKLKVKLLKQWTNPGDQKEHAADTVLDLPADVAKTLIGVGIAEEVATKKTIEEEIAAALDGIEDKVAAAVAAGVTKAAKGLKLKEGAAIVAGDAEQDAPNGGFPTFGHFAKDTKAFFPGGKVTERMAPYLKMVEEKHGKAATGMGEASGADGGLLIPEQYAAGIWARAQRGAELLSKIDMVYITGNTFTELAESGDTEAAGVRNAGVRGYWLGEGGQITASKPTFRPSTLRLKKLAVLVYASDELLEDAPMAVGQFLEGKAGDEIGFQIGDKLINGDGVAGPLGVLNAPCLVTVSKETDQEATTFVAQNVSKMWSRMWGPSRPNAVWNLNQDVEPQLDLLNIGLGTSGQLVFIPAGGLAAAPNGNLKGKPIEPTPWNATLGTVGDVLFADWSQYRGIAKSSGVQAAASIHLRFDYGETAYRFIYRMDGRPKWPAALTPYKGTGNTLSPFVVVESRT